MTAGNHGIDLRIPAGVRGRGVRRSDAFFWQSEVSDTGEGDAARAA
jgi:hypothetical protein